MMGDGMCMGTHQIFIGCLFNDTISGSDYTASIVFFPKWMERKWTDDVES